MSRAWGWHDLSLSKTSSEKAASEQRKEGLENLAVTGMVEGITNSSFYPLSRPPNRLFIRQKAIWIISPEEEESVVSGYVRIALR